MKAFIDTNHVPISKYKFEIALVVGEIEFLTMTMPEEELDVTELPDRTFATGGRSKPVELAGTLASHEKEQQAYLELWYEAAQDPVLPLYKRPVIIRQISLEETTDSEVIWSLDGCFPFKRKPNDLDVNNEGEIATVEWTFKADNIRRIL